MTNQQQQPTDGCPWYPHRFNVVPFGGTANELPSMFEDSLDSARAQKDVMLTAGAAEVMIYDTVDGLFY